MARTPLVTKLQDAVSAAAEAHETGRPIDEVLETRAITRRRFLRDAGAGAAVVGGRAAFGPLAPLARAAAPAAIVVVGAGLAGLTCAYRLLQAGLDPIVYEASDRIGGRCWTLRGHFAGGQIAERGGELIDTGHHADPPPRAGAGPQARQPPARRAERHRAVLLLRRRAVHVPRGFPGPERRSTRSSIATSSEASFPTLFDSFTERGAELNAMSIVDWIEESVPGGMSSKLGSCSTSPTRSSTGPTRASRRR